MDVIGCWLHVGLEGVFGDNVVGDVMMLCMIMVEIGCDVVVDVMSETILRMSVMRWMMFCGRWSLRWSMDLDEFRTTLSKEMWA